MLEELRLEFRNLEEVAKSVHKGKSFDIDLGKLPSYENFHNCKRFELPELGALFSYLNTLKKKTCIYVWEAKNPMEAKEINQCYVQNKARGIICSDFGVRKTHAYGLQEYQNLDTSILYVGTRLAGYTKKWDLTHIEGRIIQHLGYYHKGSTHALQLRYWATDYTLRLKIFELPTENKNHYQIIEKLLALHFKPLIGKH